jgi:hypothetical protein
MRDYMPKAVLMYIVTQLTAVQILNNTPHYMKTKIYICVTDHIAKVPHMGICYDEPVEAISHKHLNKIVQSVS